MKKSKMCLLLPFAVFTAFIFTSGTIQNNDETNKNIDDSNVTTYVINEGEEEEEKTKKTFSELMKTYIVPLVSGLSLTTIATGIISITFAILNRKNNIKSKNNVLDMATTCLESIKVTNECIKLVKEQKELNAETLKLFTDQTDKVINQVAKVTKQTETLERLKESHKSTVHALSLIASNTKELVTTGVANEINDLDNEVKEI